jgi:hypothetical protein
MNIPVRALYMSGRKNSRNCYIPHTSVTSYLEQKLEFEQTMKELTEAGKKLSETQEKRRRALDTKKVEILNNYIYPSMADIVVFLEYAQKEELREAFGEDIKELFFGIPKNFHKGYSDYFDIKRMPEGHRIHFSTVFSRFLLAAVRWNEDYKTNKNEAHGRQMLGLAPRIRDFRLLLVFYLFEIISHIVTENASIQAFGDDSYSTLVLQDLARLSIWIRLLTKDIDMDDFDVEHVSRPVLF